MTTQDISYKTRIGKICEAYQTESFSGQRDIGGSIVTKSGRIVLAAGPSDTFEGFNFAVAVSDDNGKTFTRKHTVPPVDETTYHTTGALYDSKNDIIMVLFGLTTGYKLFEKKNDYASPIRKMSPDNFGHSKLIMLRSLDDGETWEEHLLYDYKANSREHIISGGICGNGVQVDDTIYVPSLLVSANRERNAMRWEIPLLRIRTISRETGPESFEFEHDFRVLSSAEDEDMRYSDETVYVQKLDESGFISFHRQGIGPRGMPFRREYDNNHKPVSDFIRVQSTGFNPADFDPGLHGPIIIAFNVCRMFDGNLMMASRFYGTDHHKPGNIFMTSRDEGLTWDYEEDQIPYCLEPLKFFPTGGGGNPSMSYMPDGTLVHSTSAGSGLGGHVDDYNGGNMVCCFKGLGINVKKTYKTKGTVTIDTSDLVGLEPVYIRDVEIIETTSICPEISIPETQAACKQQTVGLEYSVEGPAPSVKLRLRLANEKNAYEPVLEPVIKLN